MMHKREIIIYMFNVMGDAHDTGIGQEETESSDLKKRNKEAVCRILRFWLIMKI